MAKVKLVYGSVCSGISSESVAWNALGFEAAWFSQFDPDHNYKSGPDFPSAVLAHHHPDVPNLGDANKVHEKTEFTKRKIDILVGGTPCQTFSQAGERQGFNDPRGLLTLKFLEIAGMRRPRWLVWENVPEVLSSNGGEDFGTILRKMGSIGYGYSWHVLDACHFGVPQSRKRLFVVGYLGDWKRAAAVFSGREDVRPNHRPDEGTGDADARRDDQGSSGAVTEAIAIQGNLIGRGDEAGPHGPGWRMGPMYTLTATDRHAVITTGIAIRGNTLNRHPDAERLGVGWREGPMYCLTETARHAVLANGIARLLLPVEAEPVFRASRTTTRRFPIEARVPRSAPTIPDTRQ